MHSNATAELSVPVQCRLGIRKASSNLSLRNPAPGDAYAISSLFRYAYGNSSHPCADEARVVHSIASNDTVWQLAFAGDRLVGCMAALRSRWNRSWEIGRALIVPEFRGNGLCPKLAQLCLTAALESGTCDLVFAFTRSRLAAKVAAALNPRLQLTGHDGGANVLDLEPEYHGFACGANPSAPFRHVVPRTPSLASTQFIKDRVLSPFATALLPGDYPPDWIVGDGTITRESEPFSVNYDPLGPSQSIQITGYAGSARCGWQVADELTQALESFGNVRHVSVVVPVDKTDLISVLTCHGFETTAYLPAWFRRDNRRFDCVMLVRAHHSREPHDHGLRSTIDSFREGLAPIVSPGAVQ
jgi:hypothetical protein